MGLPIEPSAPACRQRPCGVVGKEPAAVIGCRTPPRRAASLQGGVVAGGGDGESQVLVCPPAPRKKRRPAPAAVAQRTEFYTGADLEDFFAAHNF
ncbi:hypothetical protein BAE44_0021448 [Dichanthelium oligosanthes]|uniref:Uncharacterized protein n=1 Tax=Dichanthelium oligosanthes TaxID=888268 RepID=A0A1E5UXK0_9POAL|nr:hypothetical protein BAE44_0021448 [Dichanthelium oligosanthes]